MTTRLPADEHHSHPAHSRETLHTMVLDLAGKDVWCREKARHFFFRQGTAVVQYLIERLETENPILRWEIVRILADLRETSTIPGLIASLEDTNDNIRWLATEGLIRLGPPVVLPLLETLAASPGSTELREGAYQVFLTLYKHQRASRNILTRPALKSAPPSEQTPGMVRGNPPLR